MNGNEVFLLETGCRGGGAGIADKVTPWVSGVPVYEILHESLNGKTVPVDDLRPLARHAILQYYRKEAIPHWSESKLAALLRTPGVRDFQYDFLGKQYSTDPADVRHSLGIYLAESAEDLDRTRASVAEILLA